MIERVELWIVLVLLIVLVLVVRDSSPIHCENEKENEGRERCGQATVRASSPLRRIAGVSEGMRRGDLPFTAWAMAPM